MEFRKEELLKWINAKALKYAEDGDIKKALVLLITGVISEHGITVKFTQEYHDAVLYIAKVFSHGWPTPKQGDKIKVGYLTEGFAGSHSPLMALLDFIRNHDKNLFEITVYSRLGPDDSTARGYEYQKTIDKFKEAGASVFCASPEKSYIGKILQIYNKMLEDNLDILHSYVVATIPACYMLCAMHPAPVLVKECWQQPEHLTISDLTIHGVRSTFEPDTGNKVLIPQRWTRPKTKKYTRKEFGLPDDRVCIAVIGRPLKFSPGFSEKLEQAVSGAGKPALIVYFGDDQEDTELYKFMGFQEDIVSVLSLLDFCVDTAPLGGGKALIDATYAELPIVIFEENPGEFCVEEWTIPEHPANPELTIPRWDWNMWEAKIRRLIVDSTYREMMSLVAKKRAVELDTFKESMKQRENLYQQLHKDKGGGKKHV